MDVLEIKSNLGFKLSPLLLDLREHSTAFGSEQSTVVCPSPHCPK